MDRGASHAPLFISEARNTTLGQTASVPVQGPVAVSIIRALGRLLGFDSWGCQNRVFDGRTRSVARWMSRYCVKQYVDEERDDCPYGPLERVDHLGTNTAGADVYAVEYMYAGSIYIIAPPGPDGRIDHVWIAGGHRNGVVPSSLVDIRPPAAHKITVYQRPWH